MPPALSARTGAPLLLSSGAHHARQARHGAALRRQRCHCRSARAAAEATFESAPHSGAVKSFLKEMESLGDVRIITNNGCAVLEAVTTFDGLFYSPVPGQGEYANLIKPKENVDMHLLIDKVARATLESAPGRGGDYVSHFIRLYDTMDEMAVTFYVMWPHNAKRGEYAPGQVKAFEAMVARHGPSVKFQ